MTSRAVLRDEVGVACRTEIWQKEGDGKVSMATVLGQGGLGYNVAKVLTLIAAVAARIRKNELLVPKGVKISVPGAQQASELRSKDVTALADYITREIVKDLKAAKVTVTP